MIKCSVCSADNDDFATICAACKAFLQNRVPNLNLFETGWKILESPRATFHHIALAEHKNFSLFLFSLFGISLSFTAFWHFRLGNRFDTLLDLIPWAMIAGVGLGLASAIILTLIYHILAKLFGGSSSLHNSLALLAYSLVPIVLSLLLVLPIELLTFGMYLFTSNPHPYTIKPLSYVLLIGFDSLVALWSIFLAVVATMVGHRLTIVRSVFVVLLTLGFFGSAFFLAAKGIQIA